MFLDVFDLVLANILPNIEQIFKGECVFSHAVSVFLVIHNANWINNYKLHFLGYVKPIMYSYYTATDTFLLKIISLHFPWLDQNKVK